MVNFIIGACGRGKSRAVADMILNEINTGTRDVVLIVPEQQAVAWETRMASVLPPSANLRLEITNFTRLPNSVFREYGGLSDTVVDEGTRALIVWRAMLSVQDQLKVYTAGEGGHEDRAIPFLTAAVDELKQSGISPAEAEAALDELSRLAGEEGENHPSLVPRLSDAVNVYAAYNAILHEDFIDRGDLLDNLASALRAHPYFRGKAVFIDSFFSLTAPEERILSQIIAQADDVTVTFALSADGEDVRPQFAEITEFMHRTASFANRAGKEINRIFLGENRRHTGSKELAAVEEMLFDGKERAEYAGEMRPSEDVKVIRCADRYDEAEACASVIAKLIREGYRYSDIAVVARDMSTREGIIDAVLRRHGMRCFMSESAEVSSSPAVKLILAALSVAAGGWQRRDMIRLIKTGMTPHSAEDSTLGMLDTDIFETYTYTWNIRGRKMYCADRWTMNPEGYSESFTDTGREVLDAANACRERIIPPLERLLSVFGDGRGVASVREIAERITVFAEEYGVAESLDGMRRHYLGIGMAREAERTARSWDYVCEILDKMVAVIGDSPLNAVRFARLFGRLAADMDKGTIPTGVDEIVLGSATGVRFDEARCVILLGAVEDEFPRSPDEAGGFFDERDKLVLESVGLCISSPDTAVELAREYFMFYRTAASAKEKLYILAPTGGGTNLSSGADGIIKILGSIGRTTGEAFGAMPLSEILFDRVTAEYLLSRRTDKGELALLRQIAGAADGGRVKLTAENDRVAPRAGGERMTLSKSAVEKFVECRFKYCCENRVKVRPERRAEVKLNDVGSFIHRVFERFFGEIPAEKIASGELTKDEMRGTAERIIEEYVDALAESGGRAKGDYDGRLKYLFGRLSRYVLVFIEAMVNELEQSRFVPAAFELPIGIDVDGKPKVDPVEFALPDGGRVAVCGIADRVDIYDAPDGRRYVRIVDYKTGKKEFSLENISKGIEVQLLIYLFSVWKFGLPDGDGRETVPAGAVYFSTRPAVMNADSITAAEENRTEAVESVSRSGVLLNDESVLRAMEKDLGGRFISPTVKDGALICKDRHTFLVSAEQFGELYGELERTITGIAGEMRAGKAEAKPSGVNNASDPCGWCEYAFVCKAQVRK